MKNENKVTIKQKKIMIHKFSRYLLTLVALFALTTGAWANIATIEFTKESVPSSWKNNFTLISPDYLPDFKPATDAEAIAWDGASKTNKTILIYGFDGEKVKSVLFNPAGGYQTRNEISSLYDFYEQVMENDYIVCYTIFAVFLNDTKTEAEFDMPAYDATLEYDIVRNMASNMTVSVGDGEDGFRIRVKKNDQQKFEPAEMTLQAMMALFNVRDSIEHANLAFYGQNAVCALSIYAVGDNDQPTGDAIAFQALTPGRYVAMATAKEGSAYDGQTPASNIFELAEAYDLTLSPATNANLKSVTVGDETATPDENGVIKNIEPAKKVKITTTGPDYIIRKATVTKTVNMLYIEASNHKLYYMEGETWRQAINNHTDLNQGWQYGGMEVWFGNIVNVLKGNGAAVDPGSVIDPTKTYTL